jgi:hypothetical protein
MHHLRTLRTISLIIAFVFIFFGCATGKNHVSNSDFGLTAEAVPEGILLSFSNIPSNTTQMWISISSWGDSEEQSNPHNHISSYAAIEDASFHTWVNSVKQLDKIKQTGKIIFPIVQTGIKYSISVTIYNEQERNSFRKDEIFEQRVAYAELIANNGIYFNKNDVRLELNNTNSVVTLSSEPVFSSSVMFDELKYSFEVIVLIDDNRSISIGEHHFPEGLSSDGKTWAFEPYWTDTLKKYNQDWLEIGSPYSAWATIHANIIYDDIKWQVEIAKTPEFAYSL